MMNDLQHNKKPTTDNLFKKLDGSLAVARGDIKIEGSKACQNVAAVLHQKDDKENSHLDASNKKMLLGPSLSLAEQANEMEKLRNFSIQLQLMHEKGRRNINNTSVSPTSSSNQSESCSCTESSITSAANSRVSNSRQVNDAPATSNNSIDHSSSNTSEQSKHDELVKEALLMATASKKIQAVFRGQHVRSNIEAEKKAQEARLTLCMNAATLIQAKWRAFVAVRSFAEEARLTLCMNAATLIQAKWRAFVAVRSFVHTVSNIIKLQATVKMWIAMRRVHIMSDKVSTTLKSYRNDVGCDFIVDLDMVLSHTLRRLEHQLNAVSSIQSKWGVFSKFYANCQFDEVQRMIEEKAATTIVASWKRFSLRAAFERDIRGIITVQSLARRNLASNKVQKLWDNYRNDCAAILIQSNVRAFATAKKYMHIRCGIIAIQSAIRMWLASKRWNVLKKEILSAFAKFQSQGEYTLTAKDVAVCQAVVRSCFTDKITLTKSEDTATTGTTITSNEISTQLELNESDSHDFAMIYMSMMSPEADVEAIYVQSGSEV